MESIIIRGARQHNLKNISIEIPRNKFVVITGRSGSGKTSLARDTIFAEGQRRYIESISAYARQFISKISKPQVDYIEGLSPAICIDQKNVVRNPRSTVGTVTEVSDYLRLLFSHLGVPHCPTCGEIVSAYTVQEMVDSILSAQEGMRFTILSPLVRNTIGTLSQELEFLKKQGFVRIRLDGNICDLEDKIRIHKGKPHDLDVFIDRLVVRKGVESRLTESLETALRIGMGYVYIVFGDGKEMSYSETYLCKQCDREIDFPPIEPKLFSFNNPLGACPQCNGLGYEMVFSPELIVDNPLKSLRKGALKLFVKGRRGQKKSLDILETECGISLDIPWKDLSKKHKNLVLYGMKDAKTEVFEGIIPWMERRLVEFQKRKQKEERSEDEVFQKVSDEFHKYMQRITCTGCQGKRLRPEALAITIENKSISDVSGMTITNAYQFIKNMSLSKENRSVVGTIGVELTNRLNFLCEVGVHYLTLDRNMATLAGGEAQRVHLATQIGASLVGVLYILDEPSVGLHQRDHERLLEILFRLKNAGNSLIVVEHDRETMERADWIIDLGPGAGTQGGNIIAEGPLDSLLKSESSLTGKYLSEKFSIPIPRKRRSPQGQWLRIEKARGHNLKEIDADFPLRTFICVTGVSGSGKSTLIMDTLLIELRRELHGSHEIPEIFENIEGVHYLDKVIDIDQSPIGRNPRSNPATYTGILKDIRELYASLKESRIRGYGAARFSFNVKGGRCETCQGEGIGRIEMYFLPEVHVTCNTCDGNRYNRETLEIQYKGKNIAEVLDLTVDEAAEFFENIPNISKRLNTLQSVGLGYIKLGQSATTLSGGEAQRIKLSRELSRDSTGRTIYILDEPTTGLHFEDIRKLLDVLDRLIQAGNTVLVVEHNLDVIKCADWIIDLGPEGGQEGGEIVAQGSPEDIIKAQRSYTGRYLRRFLN